MQHLLKYTILTVLILLLTACGGNVNREQSDTTDTIKPIITLKGSSTITIIQGSTYIDQGATAVDNVDGDITDYIITTEEVNTDTAGTYTLNYYVSDEAGNEADVITRVVVVVQLWQQVETIEADTTMWRPYGINTVEDAGEFVKITVNADSKGAYLYLDKIADFLKNADDKNYKIIFKAYVVDGNGTNKIIIKNESNPRTNKTYLTANSKVYTIKRSNSLATKMFIRFEDLLIGSTVFIGKDIKFERMRDREYIQPFKKPFKGGTLDMNRPKNISEIEGWFQDLSEAGAKYIRIQAHPHIGMYGLSKAGYLKKIVEMFNRDYLPLVKKYNMKVLFGMESIPYDNPELNSRRNPGYWENPDTAKNFQDTARYIANAFKSTPEIFALQFMSEPIDRNYQRPLVWNKISSDVIDIVRQYTDKFIVWSNGPGGQTDYEFVVPFDDDKIIYNFHEFKPHSYTHQGIREFPYPVAYNNGSEGMTHDVDAIVHFRDRNNDIPIMCGSYTLANWISDGDLWLNDFLTLLEENNISSIQFATGQYRAWDWRYVGTNDGENPPTYIYDKTNKLWTILSEYWKR